MANIPLPEQKRTRWEDMNGTEQSQAIDHLSAMFQSLLNAMCADMNDDLSARGVPYKLTIKIDLLPAALLPQER